MKIFHLLLFVCVFTVAFLWIGTETEIQNIHISQVYAADVLQDGIVEGGRDSDYNPDGYGSCEFVSLVNNVIQFLIKISALLAVIVFLYAGFVMVSARGDSALISGAKKLFSNVLIGFVILLAAFLIINTIIGILVGGASGGLTWQKIECQYANESADAAAITIGLKEHDGIILGGDGNDVLVGSGGPMAPGAGNCIAITQPGNPCAISNLEPIFGSAAGQMSAICNRESGGTSVVSRIDLCQDNSGFSGGLFQINIFAWADKIPGCNASVLKGGLSRGGQGSCMPGKRVSTGSGSYCSQWSCAGASNSAFPSCVRALTDNALNISVAKKAFDSAGFQPWKSPITHNACENYTTPGG